MCHLYSLLKGQQAILGSRRRPCFRAGLNHPVIQQMIPRPAHLVTRSGGAFERENIHISPLMARS